MYRHPLEFLIAEYLAQKDITKGTWELYSIILKQYTEYLKDHEILFAKTKDIMAYLDWKRSFGYSSQWIYHQISAIKGLYQYLKEHQKRLDLPVEYATDRTELIPNEPIIHRIAKPVLSIDQAKHLIQFTKNNRKYIWHYRDYAMLFLMMTTGLRSIEIRRAKKSDIKRVGSQVVLYVQGKGRSSPDAFVKITAGVEEAIQDYLKKRKDTNPYLFISHSKRTNIPHLSRTFFIRMFDRVLKECGLEDVGITPHSLRHTAATLNLLRGGSLEATKQLMRHANLSTTLLYAHHLEEMKEEPQNQIEQAIFLSVAEGNDSKETP